MFCGENVYFIWTLTGLCQLCSHVHVYVCCGQKDQINTLLNK